jgi:hypothetical protein
MPRRVLAMIRRRALTLLLGLSACLIARGAFATCPTFSSVSPNPYIVGSGQQITISGSGFCTTSGCNSVTITVLGQICNATVVSGSRTSSGLRVYDPGLSAGANYDVAVSQGACAVVHKAITYQNPTPTLTSITTGGIAGGAFGSTAGGYTVTVTGTNFYPGATICFDGFLCLGTATNYVSSTQLTATVPPGSWLPGNGTAQIYNTGPNIPASGTVPFLDGRR